MAGFVLPRGLMRAIFATCLRACLRKLTHKNEKPYAHRPILAPLTKLVLGEMMCTDSVFSGHDQPNCPVSVKKTLRRCTMWAYPCYIHIMQSPHFDGQSSGPQCPSTAFVGGGPSLQKHIQEQQAFSGHVGKKGATQYSLFES